MKSKSIINGCTLAAVSLFIFSCSNNEAAKSNTEAPENNTTEMKPNTSADTTKKLNEPTEAKSKTGSKEVEEDEKNEKAEKD